MDNNFEQVIENDIKKMNNRDRALVIFISGLILLAVIVMTCIALGVKYSSSGDFQWTELHRDANGEVSDPEGYANIISLMVDSLKFTSYIIPIIAISILVLRIISIVFLGIVQLIAVLVKSKKAKKALSIITTALSFIASIYAGICILATFQIIACFVAFVDVILQLCLLIYACTWSTAQ